MYEFLASISDVVGITGVALILISYFFVSTSQWPSESFRYQICNFLGAWLMLFSLYFHWNTASVVIEIAWISISVMGMYRVVRRSKKCPA